MNPIRDVPSAAANDAIEDVDAIGAAASESTCVTCGTPLRGPYCHVCGEEVRDERDLRVTTFVRRAASGVFDADSRLWRTYSSLIARPGRLTVEFMRGRRQPYLHPLQTFLLVNLLFFALLSMGSGFNTFTTALRYHVGQPIYGEIAQHLVDSHGEPGSPEAVAFAERFDEATPNYANTMIIVMVPIFAALIALLYPRRRGFVRHLVFSLHFMTYLLLLITVIPLLMRGLVMAAPGILDWIYGEAPITILLLTCFILYLVPAMHRVYGDGPVSAVLRGVVAGLLTFPALIAYRAVLFFTVYLMVGR